MHEFPGFLFSPYTNCLEHGIAGLGTTNTIVDSIGRGKSNFACTFVVCVHVSVIFFQIIETAPTLSMQIFAADLGYGR